MALAACRGLKFRPGSATLDLKIDFVWCSMERFVQVGGKFTEISVDEAATIQAFLDDE